MFASEDDEEDYTQRGFELWRTSLRWQRTVNAVLRPFGLTHTEFLILDAASRAENEQDDAVMQRAIAEAAGLGEATTSRVVIRLAARQLLDRGISGGDDSRPWRVLVGGQGLLLLQGARPLVEAAARDFFRSTR